MIHLTNTQTSRSLLFSILFLLSLLKPGESSAQLPTSRITDWNKSGVEGDIPSGGSEILATNYGIVADGRTDNTSALNNLLKSSASLDKVIKFPAGTYRFEGSITFPSVGRRILRGTLSSSGEKLTKLIFNTGATSTGNFNVQGSYTTSEIAVVSGYTKGSTQITVSSTSGLAAGDYIELRQNNNPNIMNSYRSPDYNKSSRSIGQILRIAAVNSNTITLLKPLRFTYNSGGEFYPKVRKFAPAQRVGFEDFYTECLRDGAKWSFRISRAANSWIKNVHSYKSVRVHVEIASSINMTVRDSYFHDSFNHGGGGNGYGVLTTARATDCLVENNTFKRLRHSMMADHGANGVVFGYNKSSEGTWDSSNTPPDISVHGYFSYLNLFEGNLVENIHSADHWGPSGPGTTFFRNRVTKERLRIDDNSLDNNVAGNEVMLKHIDVHSSTKGTFVHGNVISGVTSWASGAGADNLQISYYKSQKPAFLSSTSPWPLYGPKTSTSQQESGLVAPIARAATNISQTSFTANWDAVSGAISYLLDVATTADFSTFVTGYQNKSISSTSQTISSLSAGIQYYYRVRAVNTSNTSSFSNSITVSTQTVNTTPSPTGQQVVSFTLINADTDKDIQTIINGSTLNLANLPTKNLNIRANTNPATVGSVKMVLNGPSSRNTTESGAPYALFGDTNSNYKAWVPNIGNYSLQATPYTSGGAGGTAGTSLTINFTVVNQVGLKTEKSDLESEIFAVEKTTFRTFPNPFTDKVIIEFSFLQDEDYKLDIFDARGILVQNLINGKATAAENNQVIWEAGQKSAGIYIIKLTTKNSVQQSRVVLRK